MSAFEQHNLRSQAEATSSHQVESSREQTVRLAAYSAARLAEMEGLFRRQTKLQIEDQVAAERLAQAQEIFDLAEQLDRLRGASNPPSSGPQRTDAKQARRALSEAKAAKQRSSSALTAVCDQIAAQDKELKTRFGVG